MGVYTSDLILPSMLFILTITLPVLWVVSFSLGLGQVEVSTNCSVGTVPCGGPTPVCCPSGFKCNFRRGIPDCENPKSPFMGGFDTQPCTDPYLRSCDLLGIIGYCCPIGSLCFNDGEDKVVHCIDAVGITALSFPSATTGFVPSATPVPASSTGIIYAPSGAWNSSDGSNCTASNLVYATDTLNASISFNYSGPSIQVNVDNAPNGGVFSVVVDGFNTSSTIDTFIGADNAEAPLCLAYQYPPFAIPPPGFSSQQNHTITLVFIGPSSDVPANISTTIGQFNSFAIPVAPTVPRNYATSNTLVGSMEIYSLLILSLMALNFLV